MLAPEPSPRSRRPTPTRDGGSAPASRPAHRPGAPGARGGDSRHGGLFVNLSPARWLGYTSLFSATLLLTWLTLTGSWRALLGLPPRAPAPALVAAPAPASPGAAAMPAPPLVTPGATIDPGATAGTLRASANASAPGGRGVSSPPAAPAPPAPATTPRPPAPAPPPGTPPVAPPPLTPADAEKARRASEDLSLLIRAARAYYATMAEPPPSLAAFEDSGASTIDPWGRPYRLHRGRTVADFQFSSDGPDGIADNADDLVSVKGL